MARAVGGRLEDRSLADSGSLQEALARRASEAAATGIGIHDRRGRLIERRTLPQVLEAAGRAAVALARLGVRAGSPVVVALPTSWAWIDAWLGALLAGGLPVALAPSSPLGAGEEHVRRLTTLLGNLGASHAVCNQALARRALEALGERGEAAVLSPEALAETPPGRLPRLPAPDPEATAFLQLTSGTTGDSRAVSIPHRAILHHVGAVYEATMAPLGISPADAAGTTLVSWLPLYHDMGLVGCLIGGLLNGMEVRLLPPEAFLGRPRLWLEMLGSAELAASTAPNFGYQFCVEQLAGAGLGGLDLGGWRAALVGAEMVRPETTEAFTELFAPCGFRPQSLRPCYGLAEASLAVTMDRALEGVRTAPVPDGGAGVTEEAACLGPPVADTEIEITAPEGTLLEEGRIGEIRVRGPGVFGGYYRHREATAETLVDGGLRTGDLGFLSAGELYVTGRIKEIMVVRGQNLMPHELERLAESVTGGGSCRAAAFSVPGGAAGECLVLAAETSAREDGALREMESVIRRRIGESLGLPLADLFFVPAGRLPRTTSGKVPRNRLREDYLAGRVSRLGSR